MRVARWAASRSQAFDRAFRKRLAAGLSTVLVLGPWCEASGHASSTRAGSRRPPLSRGAATGPDGVVLSPGIGATMATLPHAKGAVASEVRRAYDSLPLYFVENRGQLDARVRFYEQSRGHTAVFTAEGMFLSLPPRAGEPGGRATRQVVRLSAVGANVDPEIVAEVPQTARIHSFVGDDPARWKSDLRTYASLLYRHVYPGIDIRFHGKSLDLEYDVIVHPGADPSVVRLAVQGIEGLSAAPEGQLRMKLKDGEIVQKAPFVYQDIGGRRTVVPGRFKIHGAYRSEPSGEDLFAYGFEVDDYDRGHPLVIDPTLYYSSYLGGASTDDGLAVTVQPSGVFVTGATQSANFDVKAGSYDVTANGNVDAFVAKFDINQTGAASLVFSTYLGGAGFDEGTGIEVRPSTGQIYVTGSTDSNGFPTTAGAHDTTYNGARDAFFSRLNAAGSLLQYSTYVGGGGIDESTDLALDSSNGVVYLTGRTTTGGSGGFDAAVAKINPVAGGFSDLVYYFYLGGTLDDRGYGVEVAPGGIAYATGTTQSNNFPTTAGSFDTSANGGLDAFFTVVNAAGTAPTYSTYLGGAGDDAGRSIAVDATGRAYIAGETTSPTFPTRAGSYDISFNGGTDGFVTKVNPAAAGAAARIYSTFLGGSAIDGALGISVDALGGVCLTGYTDSTDFPTVVPLQGANAGGRDAFMAHLDAAGAALTFSTYVGGSGDDTGRAVEMAGDVCCSVGGTASANYPTTPGAFRTAYAGGASDACLTCLAQMSTAVELMAFEAAPLDAAVELSWRTGSELNNLGFHLYRALTEEGPYERVTSSVVPGLGSSAEGASYRWVDSGLTNAVTYYYKLEDIETTGRTELHGPVWAIPQPASPAGGGSGEGGSAASSTTTTAYGRPSSVSLRVLERTEHYAVLELRTRGFYAVGQPDGTVVFEIPGMEEVLEAGLPALPVKRASVDAVVGKGVRIGRVTARRVVSYPGLVPALSGSPEMVASSEGVVRARVRRGGEAQPLAPGLFPGSAARVAGTAFQGELKKALLELWPLRWDASTNRVELARRLVVRLEFAGREEGEFSRGGPTRGRRARPRLRSADELLGSFVVRERGLHVVAFEALFGTTRRGVAVSDLRLSRQGAPVAFHLEPGGPFFGPGAALYFFSEGASLNPFGNEAVYQLSRSTRGGVAMPLVSAFPSGDAVSPGWAVERWEQNKSFQPGLLEAPDLWLWETLIAPVRKSQTFALPGLVATPEPSRLDVFLQGGSDQEGVADHHVRVWVNGTTVGELSWDGKAAQVLSVPIGTGILREVDNVLELESVGGAEAGYSLVFLDRFEILYPRALSAPSGAFEARFERSGSAEVSGLGTESLLLDVTLPGTPRWLFGASPTPSGIAFRAEAGNRYLAASPQTLLHPELRSPVPSSLRSTHRRADYLLIAPRAFLASAQPLLDLRARQGLAVEAAALEEVYQDFGHGETTPHAIREFVAHAYHFWQSPSPRYVVLLGDASYDYKNVLGGSASNPVPPLLVKTSFLWTASDPAYAAVNGEDLLPDLALGRLPASSVGEAEALVQKIVAFESAGRTLFDGPAVLVADNPDRAGDFEASAHQAAPLLAATHAVENVFLRELGGASRATIAAAFDRGASLISYLGHGGIAVWASENVFNNQDVGGLVPQPQQPLLLAMDCLNGYFHFPFLNALAEELVKAPGKGAIASFAPSGLSLHGPADLFHQALLRQVASGGHERLGDAIFAAQVDFAQTGALPELLSIYQLLGDPALKIR
jgi:hypothetical protein